MCSRAALAPAIEALADEGEAAGSPVAAKRKEPEARPAGKKQKAPPGKRFRNKPQGKNKKKKKSKKSSKKSSSEAESSASDSDHD